MLTHANATRSSAHLAAALEDAGGVSLVLRAEVPAAGALDALRVGRGVAQGLQLVGGQGCACSAVAAAGQQRGPLKRAPAEGAAGEPATGATLNGAAGEGAGGVSCRCFTLLACWTRPGRVLRGTHPLASRAQLSSRAVMGATADMS